MKMLRRRKIKKLRKYLEYLQAEKAKPHHLKVTNYKWVDQEIRTTKKLITYLQRGNKDL